jgi:hypothetical protein
MLHTFNWYILHFINTGYLFHLLLYFVTLQCKLYQQSSSTNTIKHKKENIFTIKTIWKIYIICIIFNCNICHILPPSRKERRLRDGHTYQGHGKMTLVPLSCNYYCSVHLVQHSNPKLLPILDPDPGREEDHGPPVDPGCGARKARRSECRRRRGGRRR